MIQNKTSEVVILSSILQLCNMFGDLPLRVDRSEPFIPVLTIANMLAGLLASRRS